MCFSEIPIIPEIDLAFAVSASASKADKTFKLMKDTINTIINKYGTDRIRYALVVFGANPTTQISFREKSTTNRELTNFLSLARKERGEPILWKALDSVKQLFRSASSRPAAKKIVVVIVDKV